MFPFTIHLFIKQLTKPSVHDYQQCRGFLQMNSTTFFLSLPFRRIIYHPKNTSALTCLCPTVQPWLISQNKISLYIQILMFSYSLCLNNLDVSSCLNKVTQWHYNVLLYISVGRKTTQRERTSVWSNLPPSFSEQLQHAIIWLLYLSTLQTTLKTKLRC